MSFLDELKNSILSDDEKNQIVSTVNSFYEETKRIWLDLNYEMLKGNILRRAKKLSCVSFDWIFSVFSISRVLPEDLIKKIKEYNLNFDFLEYDTIYLGKVISTKKTVDEVRTRTQRGFFKTKTISYTESTEKVELSLDNDTKQMLHDLVLLAKKDGISIDTSSIFLGTDLGGRSTKFFLHSIDEPSLFGQYCIYYHDDLWFLCEDSDNSSKNLCGSLEDITKNGFSFSLQTSTSYGDLIQKIEQKYNIVDCFNILDPSLLQLKYSI